MNIISILTKKQISNARLYSDAVQFTFSGEVVWQIFPEHRDLCAGTLLLLSYPVQQLLILKYFCRERSRAFGGAVTKIDKLCPNIVRKRSRGDGSSNERMLSSGGVVPKNVPQSHLNGDDMEIGLQRGEERTKNAGQNRRIRT